MFFKIQKMLLNAMNLLYCKFNITQIIFIEDIGTFDYNYKQWFVYSNYSNSFNNKDQLTVCMVVRAETINT